MNKYRKPIVVLRPETIIKNNIKLILTLLFWDIVIFGTLGLIIKY